MDGPVMVSTGSTTGGRAGMDREMSRVALVTGAGKGIGAACARALSDAGHRVALLARSREDLDALAQDLPGETLVVPTDVTDPAALDAAFAQVEDTWGPVEILVVDSAERPTEN